MTAKFLLSLVLIPALAACGGSPRPVSASAKPAVVKPTKTKPAKGNPTLTVPREPIRSAPPSARPLALPGLEGVIGAGSAELTRQFGPPRLDAIEGDARKLQFAGTACVLDIYLYPSERGREPVAAYVDARRASDGQDVDRAACIGALRSR